jgi:hypothetical protein
MKLKILNSFSRDYQIQDFVDMCSDVHELFLRTDGRTERT